MQHPPRQRLSSNGVSGNLPGFPGLGKRFTENRTWRVTFRHEDYLAAEIGLALGPNPFAHITAFAIPQFPFL
jgi:hypothetical protein